MVRFQEISVKEKEKIWKNNKATSQKLEIQKIKNFIPPHKTEETAKEIVSEN